MIFSNPEHPLLRDISEGEDPKFILEEDVEIVYSYRRKHYIVVIPKGFITDFASIPKIFRNWLSNVSGYNKCYLLHDFQYSILSQEKHSRANSDNILRENLDWCNMNMLDRNAVYFAVRIAGGKHWKKNK
jgi:hypothetical protein